ncbi:hypothetical protein [Streptomyces sp. AS02]|uniref:hypothetical protein n=1 Tax=Streptomyces sp. AS02 TaxID=2938946 RepID=UPI0020211287|nr:hypothetical protein [Streptomyces sp. AS02]MCL8011980.1 hypothetical protein [Streptomyces sp. AS02]
MFNDAVRAREDARAAGGRFPNAGELSTRLVTQAQQTDARSWLGEVSAVVLQHSLRDAETACKNFFASLKGERKGPKVGAHQLSTTPIRENRAIGVEDLAVNGLARTRLA